MATNLNTLSDVQALNKANDDNMLSYWQIYGQSADGVHNETKISRFTTGVPFPLFNGVLQARLTISEIAPTITQTAQFYAARQLPMFWWVGPETRPSDLGEHLKAQGFHYAGDVPGMVVQLTTLPESVPVPGNFRIEQVTDAERLRQWVSILCTSHNVPVELHEPLYQLELKIGMGENVWRRYLGLLDDEPVATSVLHGYAGVAGLQAVSTINHARGRGLGAAISLKAMLDGRDMGYRIGTLQASGMGYPIYLRLGFKTHCVFEIYHFHG